jgi:hypothetical protein
MPNWCNNSIRIFGPTKQIDNFERFLNETNGKNWFDFFRPCPQELKDAAGISEPNGARLAELIEKYGASNWYAWCISHWGCKWNCDAQDWIRDGNSISFWFDSPWSPPLELYSYIHQTDPSQGLFDVEAEFHEEGMCFVGRFADGESETYAYDDEDSLENVPDDLVDNWNLREMLQERAEWNNETEEDNEN